MGKQKDMNSFRIALFLVREKLRDVRCRAWNKRIKLAWYRLWIRRNEFHSSLGMDIDAMFVMTSAEQNAYRADLMRRRDIAHRRDLVRQDKRLSLHYH